MGWWSIEYVCDDSSSAGNYWDSPNATHDFQTSGARKVGGFTDGIGNTYKIVIHKAGFALCGGDFDKCGGDYRVADFSYCTEPGVFDASGSGVLVLKRKR
jgi:hypothetical protein